jgi:hypothetical protein
MVVFTTTTNQTPPPKSDDSATLTSLIFTEYLSHTILVFYIKWCCTHLRSWQGAMLKPGWSYSEMMVVKSFMKLCPLFRSYEEHTDTHETNFWHVLFPSLKSCQIIYPSVIHCHTVCNIFVYYGEDCLSNIQS